MNIRYFKSLIVFLFLFYILSPTRSYAHAPNQSYIFLYVYQDSIGGYYEATTKDLDKALKLGLTGKKHISEIQSELPIIKQYILDHFAFSSAFGVHPITLSDPEISTSGPLGDFVKYRFKLGNVTEIPDAVNIRYDGILEADPTHRGLQVIFYNWKAGIVNNEALVSLSFDPDNTEQKLDLTKGTIMKGFLNMIQSGMHHIFIGIDHILFIIALLLPAVVRREKPVTSVKEKKGFSLMNFSKSAGIWKAVEKFKPAIVYIITIVTFFTLSHTITLSLASLGYINLPGRIVESIIALSIGLAAYHNIRPIFKKEWMIAFGFGLFHGFGFASVLGEVGLTGEFLALSLFGFNIGVELGQLAIIAAAFPILFFLRKWKYYPQFLTYSSVLLILVSLFWFTERILDKEVTMNSVHRFIDYITSFFG